MNTDTRTLRRQFERMPPMYHHRDLEKSEVIAHIRTTTGADTQQAELIFHRLRKARVLVFTMPARTWAGTCHQIDLNEEQFRSLVLTRIDALEAQIGALRGLLDGHQQQLGSLVATNNKTVAAVRALTQTGQTFLQTGQTGAM